MFNCALRTLSFYIIFKNETGSIMFDNLIIFWDFLVNFFYKLKFWCIFIYLLFYLKHVHRHSDGLMFLLSPKICNFSPKWFDPPPSRKI